MKQRYLALRAECDQPLGEKEVMNAVWDTIYQLFGEYGASQTALSKISWDEERKTLTVRCSHKMLDAVRAAIAAITVMDGKRAVIRVVAVSGTLKALRKKYLENSSGAS
jgi:ribonuclease P/MRP protein subunit POP5